MIGVAEVQQEGCMHEPCLCVMLGWSGVRSTFGCTTLDELLLGCTLIL